MTKKGNLFSLIKSLSKAEKRYFRLFAGKDDAVYLNLFDAIDKQEVYDEEAIREQFKGKAFLNQLHVAKIYLTELILKALKNYTAKKTVYSELINLLADIEILFQKELHDLCCYKIEKAERLAREYDRLDLLQAALSWKRKLMLSNYGEGMKGAAIVTEDEKMVLQQATVQNTYWDHTLNIFGRAKQQRTLLKDPLFASEAQATTLRAKVLRHHVLYILQFINGSATMAEQHLDDLITCMEQHPKRIEEDPASYITAISNKSSLLLRQQRWKEVSALTEKTKTLSGLYKLTGANKPGVRLWLRLYNVELEMYRDTRQTAKGIALIAEAGKFMEAHQKNLSADYTILLYYQFAHINFLAKNLTQSLKWVNTILNNSSDTTRTDILLYTRLLNLVLHFELDNIMVVRYALDATRRYLKKGRMLDDNMQKILSLFSRLCHASKPEYRGIFKSGYEELFAPGQQPGNFQLDYFNIKEWMLDKMGKR